MLHAFRAFILVWGLVWFLPQRVFADALNSPEEMPLPDPLTIQNFKKHTSSGLHIVEFYSPYCHHCKLFAPVWEETWRSFQEEGPELNMTMVQVDCVQSGDLCAEEKIPAYPQIRLYGPGGFIKEYPDNLKRTKEGILKFARTEAGNAENKDASMLQSRSKLLGESSVTELLKGNGKRPYAISFWPTEDLDDVNDAKAQFEICNSCPNFQRTWTVLSNKLKIEGFGVGHVNCVRDARLCEELGYGNLVKITNHRGDRAPAVLMILPQSTGNNIIFYEGVRTDVAAYEDFFSRSYSNAIVPDISASTLADETRKPLLASNIRGSNEPKTFIVFNYNPKDVVPEDFEILKLFSGPLSKMPNTYLYKSTDDLMFLARTNYELMFDEIKSDDSKAIQEPDTDLFISNSLTSSPTFFMFKEQNLIPNVFHGYSTTEMRNIDYILDWIGIDIFPLINELTPENFQGHLKHDPQIFKVMTIQLINMSSDEEVSKSAQYLRNNMLTAYDLEIERGKYLRSRVLETRSKKEKEVNDMKEKQVSTEKIVKKLRSEIFHDYGFKALFTYLDISEFPNFISQAGLIDAKRSYKSGDVLVIDKENSVFYDRDQHDEILTSQSSIKLKDAISSVLFPELHQTSPMRGKRLRGRWPFYLVGSFPKSSLFLAGAAILLLKLIKPLRFYKHLKIERRYRNKRDVVGILGKGKAKD
ncbi:LAMI_0E05490g1_1 [Lachancea mirantina]|uniref:LAMI_0E05490g1_1 n=1 Tax=Lachancea mirantina TaxID=1230905 RepID=A0A1G4JLF6_9SACH|nr:LAMI_0E05490g1_1 [Lachancea mirantina]